MSFSVIILAAGLGVRMKSSLPKVLHPIGGVPMIKRIIASVSTLNPDRIIIVYGYQGEKLKEALVEYPFLQFALQKEQQGTGHAVLEALPFLDSDSGNKEKNNQEKVLILCGDIPLLSKNTLEKLITETKGKPFGMITVTASDPKGFGRIIRGNNNQVDRIVEEKDASSEEKKISEINAGIYLVSKQKLNEWVPKLSTKNAQKEYYLTDIVSMAVAEKINIITVSPDHEYEVLGVNDKAQLAELEMTFQKIEALRLMKQGVTLLHPLSFILRGETLFGEDVTIDANVILQGKNYIGNHVSIGPNVIIKDSTIEDNSEILANSMVDNAMIHKGVSVGPFARIRPKTELYEHARIGNFVEIKNAKVGASTKINHLSYVGDAIIGNEVNIGAGTITCNYDGKNKHQTIIEDRVMVGSDTQLIAPVRVGHDVTIGAGTTIVRDVDPNQLIHNRIQYRIVKNWMGNEDEDLEQQSSN